MSEPLFTDAIRAESDAYLKRYLRRTGNDGITMIHKQAVRNELARRKTLGKV